MISENLFVFCNCCCLDWAVSCSWALAKMKQICVCSLQFVKGEVCGAFLCQLANFQHRNQSFLSSK